MTKIWVIKEKWKRRDRYGCAYSDVKLCIQRDDLCLVGQKLSYGGKTGHLDPQETLIMSALMMRAFLTHDDIYSILWPDADDEPDGAYNSIKVRIYHIKRVIAAIGAWRLATQWGQGYRLEKITAVPQGTEKLAERPAHQPEELMAPA